jgi:hypothetical protein
MARDLPEPDPVIEAYKRDVDRTLLRESLGWTWDERALALVALLRAAEEFRRAGERLRRRGR